MVWCYLLFYFFIYYSKFLDIKKIYILIKLWVKFLWIFRVMINYICNLCEKEKFFIMYRINFFIIKMVRKFRSYYLFMNSIFINIEFMYRYKMVVVVFNNNF